MRIADQQPRVGLLLEGADLGARQQDPGQHDGRGALGRDGNGANARERHARHELDRVDSTLGGDAQARQEPQRVGVARVLDGRDRRDVELPVEQHAIELRRHADDLLDLVREAVKDGRHVDVGDATKLDHRTPA
jgi:hypothetical protein